MGALEPANPFLGIQPKEIISDAHKNLTMTVIVNMGGQGLFTLHWFIVLQNSIDYILSIAFYVYAYVCIYMYIKIPLNILFNLLFYYLQCKS